MKLLFYIICQFGFVSFYLAAKILAVVLYPFLYSPIREVFSCIHFLTHTHTHALIMYIFFNDYYRWKETWLNTFKNLTQLRGEFLLIRQMGLYFLKYVWFCVYKNIEWNKTLICLDILCKYFQWGGQEHDGCTRKYALNRKVVKC